MLLRKNPFNRCVSRYTNHSPLTHPITHSLIHPITHSLTNHSLTHSFSFSYSLFALYSTPCFLYFRRSLITDKFLRVQGAEGVFSVGDCSTIERDKMVEKAEELFKMADVNGDRVTSLSRVSSQHWVEQANALKYRLTHLLQDFVQQHNVLVLTSWYMVPD